MSEIACQFPFPFVDVAKVKCDYAIEAFSFNRIFNRKRKIARNRDSQRDRKISKKMRLDILMISNRMPQSHFDGFQPSRADSLM